MGVDKSSHIGSIANAGGTALFVGNCQRSSGKICNISSGKHIGYILVFFHLMYQVKVSCIHCDGRYLKNFVQDKVHFSAVVDAEVSGLLGMFSRTLFLKCCTI
jgi:hypothetical protein